MNIIVETNRWTNFGIYKGTKKSPFGQCLYGTYKGNTIEIHSNKYDDNKLFYITDNMGKWIRSKLVYWVNGVKSIAKSDKNVKQHTELYSTMFNRTGDTL